MKHLLAIALALVSIDAHAEPLTCSENGGTNCIANIPDPGDLISSFTVPDDVCDPGATISCMSVLVNIGHTQSGDLAVRLAAEDGTNAFIATPTCCEGRDTMLFSDGGGPNFGLCGQGPVNRPVEPFAVFRGKPPSGVWALVVSDIEDGHYGVLDDWALEIGCLGSTGAADLGSPCVRDSQCSSCYCVDGVCCDSACGGGDPNDCQACSTARGASDDGTCQDLLANTPWAGAGSSDFCDSDDADHCPRGTLSCTGGVPACLEIGDGAHERCNDADDDCDGLVDEDFGAGNACDGDDDDRCALGVLTCSGIDAVVCIESESHSEVCDNDVDDDCDGATDEGCEQAIDTELGPARVHGSGACSGGDAGLALAMAALALLLRRRAAWLVVLLAVPARAAEPSFDVRYHQPVPGGPDNGVVVHDPLVLQHLGFSVGVLLDYAADPLVVTFDQTGDEDVDVPIIKSELRADLLFAIGLFDFLDVGVALPVLLTRTQGQSAEAIGGAIEGFALGDLRIVPKWQILGREYGFGMALALPITLPTSGGSDLAGDSDPSVEPRLVLGYRVPRAAFRANVGYLLRTQDAYRELDVGNEVRIALGADVELVPDRVVMLAEGLVKLAADGDSDAGETTSAEIALGAKVLFGGHVVTAGVGAGLTEGYGTPAWHVFAGYSFTTPRVADTDGDGIRDPIDKCPTEPEDDDDFQDEDGCVDPDDDDDGILDAVDRCRLQQEDKDGFEDQDGCPDADNDHDRIVDASDKCPNEPETPNGYEDADGCPDVKRKAEVHESKIDLSETIRFATNESVILPESLEVCDDIVATLNEHPELIRLEVAGHTDELGTADHNQGLSERRAQAVMEYLTTHGVAPARLVAKGYGETQPLVPGDDPSAYAKNRRVEIRILERKAVTP